MARIGLQGRMKRRGTLLTARFHHLERDTATPCAEGGTSYRLRACHGGTTFCTHPHPAAHPLPLAYDPVWPTKALHDLLFVHALDVGATGINCHKSDGFPISTNCSNPRMPDRAPVPTPERKPAWCAACLAYREKRRAGVREHQAHLAAVAALQAVWPLAWKEASAEAVNAIAYASSYDKEWTGLTLDG